MAANLNCSGVPLQPSNRMRVDAAAPLRSGSERKVVACAIDRMESFTTRPWHCVPRAILFGFEVIPAHPVAKRNRHTDADYVECNGGWGHFQPCPRTCADCCPKRAHVARSTYPVSRQPVEHATLDGERLGWPSGLNCRFCDRT